MTFIFEILTLSIILIRKKSISCVAGYGIIHKNTQKASADFPECAGCCMYPCDVSSSVALSSSQINDLFIPILGCTLKHVHNFSIAYMVYKKSPKIW